jgi:hypothetical protein
LEELKLKLEKVQAKIEKMKEAHPDRMAKIKLKKKKKKLEKSIQVNGYIQYRVK